MEKVFLGPESGIWKCIYNDAVVSQECEYCSYEEDKHTRFEEMMLSGKFHNLLPHFVRRFLYRKILRFNFLYYSKDKTILFVFSNAFSLFGSERLYAFIDYLKKEFINSKFAIHYMESLNHCYPDQIGTIKEVFDLVLSFDHYDYKRFNVKYYPPVCEKNTIQPTGFAECSDVFYVGGTSDPKYGRIDLCFRTFKYLSDNNIKCIFYLYGVSPKEQSEIAKLLDTELIENMSDKTISIIYNKSTMVFSYIPYSRALKYIQKTKAMLEIVPRGSVSCTSRLSQAMVAEKKLITNSDTSYSELFYKPENMFSFETPEDIDLSFFEKPFVPIDFDFSTLGLINYIENQLFTE